MTTDTVLFVTASYDFAPDYVGRALENLGVPYFRLDTDRFPEHVTSHFSPERGLTIWDRDSTVSSQEIKSVWYRRNVRPAFSVDLDNGFRDLCERESRAFLTGALLALPTTKWLSHPMAIWRAEHKPYQLAVAAQLGFSIPSTVITNDKRVAQDFAVNRRLVAKAVSSGYVATPSGNAAIFTSSVSKDDLADLEGLNLAPVIFQQMESKQLDVRVTVVGDDVFGVEILSQTRQSSSIDWRATDDPNLEHRVHDLPFDVAQRCRALLEHLGLAFGAIDLALTEDGSYVFFEINPNGEWVWLEDRLGIPISSAIAQWLAS